MKRFLNGGWLVAALFAAVLLAVAMQLPPAQRGTAPPAANPPADSVPVTEPVNLINASYPPAVAGPGWPYHKALEGDFDGDGAAEKLHVITNAGWDEQNGRFEWDDGHPWHVYIEEGDGARTYLFSNWVQLGVLDAYLTTDPPGVLLLAREGAGVSAYRVTYRGPGKQEAVKLMSVGTNGVAGFTDPRFNQSR
jgi:hypothetical protein